MNLTVTLIAVALVVYIVRLESHIKNELTQRNLIWDAIKAISGGGKATLNALDMTDSRVSILEGKLKAIPESAVPEEVFAQMLSQFHKADALKTNQ